MIRSLYTGLSRKLRLSRHLNRLFSLFPVKNNKIVFSNFQGNGYGCDPKYICEELRRRNLGLDLVWLVSDPSKGKKFWDLPDDVRMVKFGSKRACYELSTSHIWVFNSKGFEKPEKKKGQFYVQTWHSSLALKAGECDASDTLPPGYIEAARQDAAMTDLMYSNNDFRYELYKNRFWYHGPVIKSGVPRLSVLFSTPDSVYRKVREYFSLPLNAKTVLYAPTFRKDMRTDIYLFDYLRCLECLSRLYGAPFVFLLRLHPNVSALPLVCDFGEKIKNATYYPDVEELLAVCDVLITDYSACMFDAAFAGKPVFLYTPDLQSYISGDRRLYFSPFELPFTLSSNSEELCRSISGFSSSQYREDCLAFFKKIGLKEDGTGDKQVADILISEIERKAI